MSAVDLTLRAAYGKPAETREVGETIVLHRFERASENAPVQMFITAGMSERKMKVPREAAKKARAELVFYASEPKSEYFAWLSWLAQFPFIDETWLGFGHTVPWSKPMLPGSPLTHFWFLETIVTADRTLFETLKVENEPVSVLWVVPITAKEKELKSKKGVGPLLDVLEANRHPWLFPGDRKSYVL